MATQYDHALKLDLKKLSLEEDMYGGWVLSNHPLLLKANFRYHRSETKVIPLYTFGK